MFGEVEEGRIDPQDHGMLALPLYQTSIDR
jgi:hypothetical protein